MSFAFLVFQSLVISTALLDLVRQQGAMLLGLGGTLFRASERRESQGRVLIRVNA